jgi:hypothetical protein
MSVVAEHGQYDGDLRLALGVHSSQLRAGRGPQGNADLVLGEAADRPNRVGALSDDNTLHAVADLPGDLVSERQEVLEAQRRTGQAAKVVDVNVDAGFGESGYGGKQFGRRQRRASRFAITSASTSPASSGAAAKF